MLDGACCLSFIFNSLIRYHREFLAHFHFVLNFVFSFRSELTSTTQRTINITYPTKMRRYIIAFWILLVSVSHFALTAPVAVRKILEGRSYEVDVLKDGITSKEKRMYEEDQWSTNEAILKDGDNQPGNNPHVHDAPGDDDEDMLGWESGWDSEELGSDGRGPDPYYNNPPEEDSEGDNPPEVMHKDRWSTNEAYLKDDDHGSDVDLVDAPGGHNEAGILGLGPEWYSEQMKSDGRGPDPYYNNPQDMDKDILKDDGAKFDEHLKYVGSKDDDDGNPGYHDNNDPAVQSKQASAEDPPPIPGLESEHPAATPEHTTPFEELLKYSPRPRNSNRGRC